MGECEPSSAVHRSPLGPLVLAALHCAWWRACRVHQLHGICPPGMGSYMEGLGCWILWGNSILYVLGTCITLSILLILQWRCDRLERTVVRGNNQKLSRFRSVPWLNCLCRTAAREFPFVPRKSHMMFIWPEHRLATESPTSQRCLGCKNCGYCSMLHQTSPLL